MTPRKFFQKISKDLLISLTITYFFILIPEIILPGIVSSHFSPKYLLIVILFLGLFYAWLAEGQREKEGAKFNIVSRHLLHIILFVITIMLVLSLYKMKIWQIAVVATLSILLVIAAGKMIVSEEER
jgi:cell division protein FtsW (lipid II flippase)